MYRYILVQVGQQCNVISDVDMCVLYHYRSPIVRQPSLAKNIRSGKLSLNQLNVLCSYNFSLCAVMSTATDGVQFKLSDMMDKKQHLVEVGIPSSLQVYTPL